MCELFAMSSRHRSNVRLSLEEFSRHGGQSGPHKDGWGIAWYDAGDVRLLKEPLPAAQSDCIRFVQAHPFEARMAISHIRKATRGEIAQRNCQPFIRELGGAWHSFAHNGDLPGIATDDRLQSDAFRPVGETDSEAAFCALLEQLRPLWLAHQPPPLESRREIVAAFAARLRSLGPSNFLYCDGDAIFAHADRRHQRDGGIRPPGLWHLARRCPATDVLTAEGLSIRSDALTQDVVLIASVPLTDEPWVPMAGGELLIARHGCLV
ncbi:MAG: class II glutamine amidotransferase [Burkholderiaceae bacterium]